MPGPFVFLVNDWAGRDIALEESCWERYIKRRRQWNDDQMLPLIRQTIQEPDAVFESQQHARRAEVWRRFDDAKDGQPGFVQVIVEYDGSFTFASSGDVRTAMVSKAIDSTGRRLWGQWKIS
jgi:phage-Barnase-EndoU-ColicinE5/D-RelE like nuclease2